MSNAIQIYDNGGFEMLSRAATAMAKSGFFQDSKDVSKAMVKVMAGAELGIAPFAAMSGIAIIQGKPSLGASLMAGIVKNDRRYDYRVTKHDDTICSIQFYEIGHGGQWEPSGVSTFTAKDASRAGTKNMGKYPKNMLFARAMSNGFKWYCAGAGGGMPVYTDGEIVSTAPSLPANIDTSTGEIIDGEEFTGEIDESPPFDDQASMEDAPTPETDPRELSAARDVPTVVMALQNHAEKNTAPANAKQIKFMRSSLSDICDGVKMEKSVMKFALNLTSGNDATSGQASAIIDWIGKSADNGYTASEQAKKEAHAIYREVLLKEGQQELKI